MNSQSQTKNQIAEDEKSNRTTSGETILGLAVLECLAAGAIGICKALASDGLGAGVCLLASVAAFGMVCYVYFRTN
jgi:hypothetical protein